jgi:hypothetical protein
MRKTLLEYVQDILNDMDEDFISSIDDTDQSVQVANIVKTTYEAMMSNRNWPHTRRALQLESSGSVSYPVHMSILDNLKELILVNYNIVGEGETRRNYRSLNYKYPDDFLRYINNRNSDLDTVDIILDYSGIELLITNDQPPTFFTSFDDKNLVFDSYDSDVEATLQSSKVQAQGYVIPDFEVLDTFIPDIPKEAEAALLEEAKSNAMFKLKQTQDIKAEQEARRQQSWLSRKARRISGGVKYPNYGRRGYK